MASKFAKALKVQLAKKPTKKTPSYVVGFGGALVVFADTPAEAKAKVKSLLAALTEMDGVQTTLCETSVLSPAKL